MKLLITLTLLLGVALAEEEDWVETIERECPCTKSGLWLDIAIAIDTSCGMTQEGLIQVLGNIATVFEPTKIAQGEGQHSRLSVITYGANATVKFRLEDFKSTDDMLTRIWDTTCGTEAKANLYDALRQTQIVFEDHDVRERRNVKTVIIVYASSYRHGHFEDPIQLANQIKISGTDIIVIAFDQNGKLDALKKLEKIASPGFFFKNTAENVADEIQEALCLTNCFCTKMWAQYKNSFGNTEVKYGECLRIGGLEASWYPAQMACQRMGAGRGHLVNIFDIAKHNFVAELYKSDYRFYPPHDYHIGLHYKKGGAKPGYFWDQPQGKKLIPEENAYFRRWAPGYPDVSKGECVVAKVPSARLSDGSARSSSELYWENEKCSTPRRYICQKSTCDTDHYCSLTEIDQMVRLSHKKRGTQNKTFA